MVELVTGKPHRTRTPEVVVENPLKPGRYRFSLVVIDTGENVSEPFELAVSVVEQSGPITRGDVIRDRTILRRPTPEPSPVVERIRPVRPVRPS